MSTRGDAASALMGVSLILRFDRRGFEYFDRSADGAWRSFRVAFLVLPVFALQLFGLFTVMQPTPALPRFLLIETLTYTISWFAYPMALWYLSAAIHRRHYFVGYIAPYNWCQLAAALAALPLLVLSIAGLMQNEFGLLLYLGYQVAVFVYLTFIAVVGLNLPVITALMVAVFDVVLTELISAIGTLLITS